MRCLPRVGLILLLMLPLFGLPLLAAQSPVTRGHYYRCDDPAIEMWIPSGLSPRALDEDDRKSRDDIKARFSGYGRGAHEIVVQVFAASTSSIDDYLVRLAGARKEDFPDATHETKDQVQAGPFAAAITLTSKFGEENKDYQHLVLVRAGIRYDGERTIELIAYAETAEVDRALQQVRWILGTVRRPGEAGFDPFLARRRIDLETGLSYRPPRELTPIEPPEGASFLFRGEGGKPRVRVTISPIAGHDLGDAVKKRGQGQVCMGGRRLFPHEPDVNADLFGGLYRADDKGRAMAILAAHLEKKYLFLVTAEGPFEARESLLRTAELTAMGLRFVDVEAAKKDVAEALAKLKAAEKARDAAAVAAAVDVLVLHPYLERVPDAVAGALKALPGPKALAAVARALAEHGSIAQLPALVKAVRYYRSKRDPAAVTALVPALARIRGKKAALLLLDLARRKEVEPAEAAIRALGHYREPSYKITAKLVALMARAEAAGRRNRMVDRERWLVLRPAYQDALHRLTGRNFESAVEAKGWLRK